MNRLTQSDLLSPADYEAQRTTLRQEIIALKKRRRIEVGPWSRWSLRIDGRCFFKFRR